MSHQAGPGGCVKWDDFAEWIRRVDVITTALDSASNIDGVPVQELRRLWSCVEQLRVEVDAAMVVNGVERIRA